MSLMYIRGFELVYLERKEPHLLPVPGQNHKSGTSIKQFAIDEIFNEIGN